MYKRQATRTLVLVDGRRLVPNTATGLVDLNAIPTSLIERVEVVTGGASAAWGSDAVAGVPNFILKKTIEGFEASLQYGQSQRHDQREKSASLAWGTPYAGGRGQFMIAGEYSSVTDPARVGNRPWGNDQWGWVTGTIDGRTVTRIAVPGVTASGVSYGGVIVAANGGDGEEAEQAQLDDQDQGLGIALRVGEKRARRYCTKHADRDECQRPRHQQGIHLHVEAGAPGTGPAVPPG